MKTHYSRPAILDTIPRDRHAVIEASAGTGKTYTIEHLVVELILQVGGPTIGEVLVLTFTERAAAELRKRIRGVIVKILDATCAGGAGCRCDARGGFWSIDERARKRLTQTLFSLDTAAIGTIHGFFARVLTEHAFAGGRLFDGALEDGRTLFGRAFKTALRRELASGEPGDTAELADALARSEFRGSRDRPRNTALQVSRQRPRLATGVRPGCAPSRGRVGAPGFEMDDWRRKSYGLHCGDQGRQGSTTAREHCRRRAVHLPSLVTMRLRIAGQERRQR